MVSVSLLCLSLLIRASVWHTLSSIVDMLGHQGCCLLSTSVLPYPKALHQPVSVTIYTLLTSTNWQWISTNTAAFKCKNWITLCTSIFDHVCSRPAIKLIVQWCAMFMVSCHGCTMTQLSHACYVVTSTVGWWYFMWDCCYLIFVNSLYLFIYLFWGGGWAHGRLSGLGSSRAQLD
jgi:hypothetical protein